MSRAMHDYLDSLVYDFMIPGFFKLLVLFAFLASFFLFRMTGC